MNKFFYLLKGTLYRSVENPEDFIEINEIFHDDNPIEARERALEVYQNYVDVLLQSIGEEYESHEMARLALKKFLEEKQKPSKLTTLMNVGEEEEALFKIENDFDKGISLHMVMSDSKTFTTLEGEIIYEDKILIHDLNSELTGIRDHIKKSLIKEFEIYIKYGYECKDYAMKVSGIGNKMILRTPMVFGGMV